MAVTSTGLTSGKDRKASRGRLLRGRSSAPAVPVICPYLIAEDGAWRSARPSRDHRCGAVEPAAALALDKQRRLCLVKAHASCATLAAALADASGQPVTDDPAAAGDASPTRPAGATRWSLVRTAPVVLDSAGGRSSGGGRRRPPAQWALGGLMALALGALVLARLPEPEPPGSRAVLAATGVPSATTRIAAPAPTMHPPRTPRPVPALAPALSTRPPAAPTTTPTTYVVRAGDTLYAIARAHETTVEALQDANGLGDSTTIQIGRELVLP